jgi:hypothetical protein
MEHFRHDLMDSDPEIALGPPESSLVWSTKDSDRRGNTASWSGESGGGDDATTATQIFSQAERIDSLVSERLLEMPKGKISKHVLAFLSILNRDDLLAGQK